MSESRDIAILEWYKHQELDEITSNNTRNYLKKQELTQCIEEIVAPKLKHIPPSSAYELARKIADSADSLQKLKADIESFDACPLKKTASKTVVCDGVVSAKIMLIGEAPGANEDLQGIPFCGESGKLLDKILASVDISRKSNLYITNSIFWRPPGNRKPTDEEIKCCLPFVEKSIGLLNPDLVILAGSVACSTLFGDSQSISKMRQKVMMYKNQYLQRDVPVIIIFHPSYLLRQPSQKKLAWQDMLFINNYLEQVKSN